MGPLETNAFPEKPWRPSVNNFVRRCCFVGFSVGHSGICLAEEGGSNGTIGSRTVPRKSSEPVRGTISADDDVLFDINTSPEFVMEQSVFFSCGMGQGDFFDWRQLAETMEPVETKRCSPEKHWNSSGNNLDRRCCFVCCHDGPGGGNRRKQRGHRK